MKIILTILYLIFTTGGLTLMKFGGDSISIALKNGLSFKIGYITLLGFLCYLLSFLIWQKLLVTFDLSYIVPITTGIVQIIVLLLGLVIFQESISITGIIGVILIIIGVILTSIIK